MPVPAPPRPRRIATPRRPAPVVPLAVLLVTGAAGAAAGLSAPAEARGWTVTTILAAWLCLAVGVVASSLAVRRVHRSAAADGAEAASLKTQLARQGAESAHLVNVTLPGVVKRLRDGAGANETLAQAAPPSDPQLRQALQVFASVVEESVRQTATAESERDHAQGQLAQAAEEFERLTTATLPDAIAQLREGASADTVLAGLAWPQNPLLSVPATSFVRELAHSERRAAAAQAASAKALSRVQAKSVSMLADLRDMQERHSAEVFGDLLRLDHSTSQLGLLTDRLALLMGGRSSRAWNKPIVMESILRGAVGRISAYQRVRLHCSTTVAIAGFAAEGVMHLLAELMDNAANFSPPIDEVHVYVEERSAGIVVTIEDSGLKMADAAMRRAEESVSGQVTDLASLQGTRLGLAVVGRLAGKYGMSVNFRPSSRGGTGVVVLLPPQLLAQQRDPAPQQQPVRRSAEPAVAPPVEVPEPPAVQAPQTPAAQAPQPSPVEAPAPPPVTAPAPQPVEGHAAAPDTPEFPASRPEIPAQQERPRPVATANGLPVRAPGRTMAEADRERQQRRAASDAEAPAKDTERPRDAGARFGAFHRARRAGTDTSGTTDASGTTAESGPPPAE
ncbi:ATP-binding protein [Streptomyces sp. NPDC050658]|uniref:ATP-binding protein n=1 Tax=unclassified Streptomyces TaxID=2593676 RepID=UPI00341DDA40